MVVLDCNGNSNDLPSLQKIVTQLVSVPKPAPALRNELRTIASSCLRAILRSAFSFSCSVSNMLRLQRKSDQLLMLSLPLAQRTRNILRLF